MRTVIAEFSVKNYKVLKLDGSIPMKEHKKYRIAGKEYEIVLLYDMPNCIAIEAEGTFVGEPVDFI